MLHTTARTLRGGLGTEAPPVTVLMVETMKSPEGPCTAKLRALVPKTIPGTVFISRLLQWQYMDPLGREISQTRL